MFGPNVKVGGGEVAYYHHRERAYTDLLLECDDLLRRRLGVGDEYDILFLSGSGTLANESVIFSLADKIRVYEEGTEFGGRLKRLAQTHGAYDPTAGQQAAVCYETAESRYNFNDTISDDVVFADCVSSFPYYDPPDVPIWTTVSSKQIGAAPIVSMVFVREDSWGLLEGAGREAYSYLNLHRYKAYQEAGQSPHTPAMSCLVDLRNSLQRFPPLEEFRRTIDERREILKSKLPSIGEGPVFTTPIDTVPWAKSEVWSLYESKRGYQFFLYSGSTDDYKTFVEDL